MAKKSKQEMLSEMKSQGKDCICTINSSWQEIKEEYDEWIDMDDSDLFPNGRDFDAEDEGD